MVSRTADVLRRMFFPSWRRTGGKSGSGDPEHVSETLLPEAEAAPVRPDAAARQKPRERAGKPVIDAVPGAHGASAASFAVLTAKLDYLDEADVRRVREAYRFADEAHLGQFRASGEPYITHPIAVAGLCADWKLDVQAIMAALMQQ